MITFVDVSKQIWGDYILKCSNRCDAFVTLKLQSLKHSAQNFLYGPLIIENPETATVTACRLKKIHTV